MKIQERKKRRQLKIIALFGLVFLVLVGPRLDAQVVVDIPDANLEAAIREALSIPTDPLTDVDMASLTLFSAQEKEITNLTGLEYCVNLRNLYLGNNEISDISPLSGLTDLMELEIYENNITNISPLTGLIKLDWLLLYSNNITDITTLAGLTNLRSLDLGSNNISDFSPLLGLTNLSTLLLNNSNISDISLFAGLTNLTGLRLNDNNITDISPLAGLTNLNFLELEENNISDISPLAGLTNLIYLSLDGNNISDISPIAGMTKLTQFVSSNNNISDISPLSGLTNLTVLVTSSNNISDISPLAGLTKLVGIYLQRNNISDISTLAGLTNLELLSISGNNISDISPVAGLTNLEHLNLENTNTSDISDLAELTNLTYLNLDENNITDISLLAGFTNLTLLRLNDNNISDISPISDLMNLTYLDLGNNQLDCDAYLTIIPLIIENNPDIEIYYDPMPPDCESVNQPPEAVDDAFSTHIEMSVIMDVLTNDSDPDEDEIVVVQFTQPEHGDLVLNPDDTFTYTPEEGFTGEDSFNYEISDGLLSATATVTIMVNNLPPVANDDIVTTLIDTYVEFNIFVNDSDPDEDPYTITSMGSPSNGTLLWWNPDGQCAYMPDESFIGEDSFVYEISDGWLSDTAMVTINVTESYLPEDQIEEILDFVDVAVDVGTLTGDGPGNSGDNRLNALTNMLEEAQSLIEVELYEEAFEQLESVYKHVDGESPPKDFVKGEAAANVAAMIENLVENILDVM